MARTAARQRTQERLDLLDAEGNEPTTVDEDYLRDRNPVFHRPLLQLTMGAPQPIYYGGLVMAQLRHFDVGRRRPGLPDGVAALVEDVSEAGVSVTLVNLGSADEELVVQAGAYGEHRFESVETDGEIHTGDEAASAGSNTIRVDLPSGRRLSLSADLDRFVNDPTYALPWA